MFKQRLNQTIPTWKTDGGIFTYLNDQDVPWIPEEGSHTALDAALDLDYHGGHSGGKKVSPLVDNLTTEGLLDSTALTALSKMAVTLFSDRWQRMYEQMFLEYNPISNYDMTESEDIEREIDITDAHTGTDTISGGNRETHSGSDVTTNTGTQTTTAVASFNSEGSNGSEDKIAGFNSSTYVNSTSLDSDTTAESSSDTAESRINDLTERLTHGHVIAGTKNESVTHGESIQKSGSDTTGRTLTRSGNIGVTTTAQMLEGERMLWAWNFFRNVVYVDLDSLLTIQTY